MHSGKKCIPGILICLLVVVGALNWGLVGIGMLMNNDLNVVHMLVGAWPMVEAIVYILVGVAGIGKIFHDMMCPCKKDCCGDCGKDGKAEAPKM